MSAAEAFFESRERNVFVATTPAAQVLAALEQGLEHALPIVLLTGEAGVGKTATLHEAVARWSSRVQAAWLDASGASTSTIFADTIRAFGGHVRGKDKRPEQVGRLTHALGAIRQKGLTPLLVVDSAQLLDNAALTELGRIESASSAAGFELKMILAGRPELVSRLASDQHEPIEVHVGVRTVHGKMSLADTRDYLTHVLGGQTTEGDEVFSKKSAREIHEGANGLPAMVNALADEAIRCAHAAGSAQVGPEHVRAVLAAAFPGEPGAEPAGEAGTANGGAANGEGASPTSPGAAQSEPGAQVPSAAAPDARAAIPEKPKRIAAHKPPAPPAGAVARVPPPPARKRALPTPPASDLDSSHPRVRDWVSRFTAGQPPIRFGGRGSLPAGDLSEMLPAETPEASPPALHGASDAGTTPPTVEPPRNRRLERARDTEAAKKLQLPAAPTPRPAPAPAPIVPESSVQAKSAAAPPRAGGQPAPADLTHIARLDPAPLEVPQAAPPAPAAPLEITPEQLTPPPLVLDESPAAPATPFAATPAPAAPVEPPRLATPPVAPAPPRFESRPAPAAQPRPVAATPPTHQPGLSQTPAAMPHAASQSGSSPAGPPAPLSRKQQKAAARRAERAARRMAEVHQAPKPSAPSSASPSASAPAAPSAHAPAAPSAQTPLVLTPAAVKPVSTAPVVAARSSIPRTSATPVLGSTTVPHIRPARPNELPSGDATPPRIDRVLAVLIPAVLILGMAIAAFILGRRGAFDRQADAGSDRVDPVTTAAAPTPPRPAPVAVPDSAAASETKPDSMADTDSRPFEPPIGVPVEEPSPAPEPGAPRYCLAVGTYLYEDRAREKARTLAGRTGQKAWVEPIRANGQRSFRILFGAYTSESAAERDADRLLSRSFVSEAMVEHLPASRRRR